MAIRKEIGIKNRMEIKNKKTLPKPLYDIVGQVLSFVDEIDQDKQQNEKSQINVKKN